MKGGKEVYGVIWEDRSNGRSEHYFASPGEYKAYREAKQLNDIATCEKLKLKVDIEEVVDAECLEAQ